MKSAKKIFFVHIPKTGGITVEKALEQLPNKKVCPAYRAEEFFKLTNPDEFDIYHGHLLYYTKEFINPDLIITVLRDPIERSISAFEHIARDLNHPLHSDYKSSRDILEALKHRQLNQHISNSMVRFLGLRPEFSKFRKNVEAARYALKHHPTESLLENAKEAIANMDFIAFTECLDLNILQINKIIDLPQEIATPPKRINLNPAKPNKPYKETINKEILDALIDANKLDIELYEYAKDIAQSRGWFIDMSKVLPQEIIELQETAKNNFLSSLRQKPEITALSYTFDQPLNGDGWHTRETDGSLYWRFTGPGTMSSIYFPRLSEQTTKISLKIFHAIAPAQIDDIKIIINAVPLKIERIGNTLEGQLNNLHKQQDYTEVQIVTPRTICPEAGDNRLLGVAFHEISFN